MIDLNKNFIFEKRRKTRANGVIYILYIFLFKLAMKHEEYKKEKKI